MRIVFKYTIFTILSVIFLMPALASAQTDNPGSARGVTTPTTGSGNGAGTGLGNGNSEKNKRTEKTQTTDEAVELVFPDIADWERGEVRTYPTEELGFSVPYSSQEGGTISIFVYNGGYSNIADGVNDKTVIEEFDRTKGKILKIGEMGVYQNVRELKSDTVTLGGSNGKVRALRALYTFKLQGQDVDTEIFIFGYKGQFIKIMSTRAKAKNGAENKAVVNLLAAFDQMFAK